MSRLLCQLGTQSLRQETSTPVDEGATASVAPPDQEIDELVFMKESMRLGPFQTQIIECKTKPLLGESTHVMIMPLRVYEAQPDGVWPLLPGLHVLHAYTWLKMSSNKVSIVVRNMLDSPIFLKKGIRVACLVPALPVPPMELTPKMEAAQGTEVECEPMTVATWQKKLLEKLNLDGLRIGLQEMWLPQESSSWLSMTSSGWIKMSLNARVQQSTKSTLIIGRPSKSGSSAFLCHFWMRCMPHSGTCWMLGQYSPAGPLGAMQLYWSRKRMELCTFAWISAGSICGLKRTHTSAVDTGSSGEYGGSHAFFNDGFQEWVLASLDGARVPIVYHLHGGKSGVL